MTLYSDWMSNGVSVVKGGVVRVGGGAGRVRVGGGAGRVTVGGGVGGVRGWGVESGAVSLVSSCLE